MTSVEGSTRSRQSAVAAEVEADDSSAVQNEEEEEQISSQPTDPEDEIASDVDAAAEENVEEIADAAEETEGDASADADMAEPDGEGEEASTPNEPVNTSQNSGEIEGGDDAKDATEKNTRLTRKTSQQAVTAPSEVKTRSALARDQRDSTPSDKNGNKPSAVANPDSKTPQRMATRRGLVIVPAAPPAKNTVTRKQDSSDSKASQLPAAAGLLKKKAADQQPATAAGKRFPSAAPATRDNGEPKAERPGGAVSKDGVWEKFPTWAEILQSYFTIISPTADTLGDVDKGKIRMKCQLCDYEASFKPTDWNVTGRHVKTHHPVLSERLRRYQLKYNEAKSFNSALPELPPISDDRNDGYDEHEDANTGGNKSPTPTKRQQQQQQQPTTAAPETREKAVTSPVTRSSDRRQQQQQQLVNGGGKKNMKGFAIADSENDDVADQQHDEEEEKLDQPLPENLPKTRSSGRLLTAAANITKTPPVAEKKITASKIMPARRGRPSNNSMLQNDEHAAGEAVEAMESVEMSTQQQTTSPKTRGVGGRKAGSLAKTDADGVSTMEQRKFDTMLAYFDIVAPPVEQLTQLVGSNAEARQRCVLRCTICQASMRIVWADCSGMIKHMQNKHTQLLMQIKRLNPELFREPKSQPQQQQHQQQQQLSGNKVARQLLSQQFNAVSGDEFSQGNVGVGRSQPVAMTTRRSGPSPAAAAAAVAGFGGSAGKAKQHQFPAAAVQKNKPGPKPQQRTAVASASQSVPNKMPVQRSPYGIGSTKSTMSSATIAKSDNEIRQFINASASTDDMDLKKHLYQSVLFFYTDFRMHRDDSSERFIALDENLTLDNDDLLARSASPVWQVIQTLSAEAHDQESRTQRRKTPLICACRLCGLSVSIRFSDIAAALDHLKRHHVRLARCLMRMREIFRRRPKAAAYVMSAENLFRLLYFAMFGEADDDTISEQLNEAQQQDGDLLGLNLTPRSSEGLHELLSALNREDAAAKTRKRALSGVGSDGYEFEEEDGEPNSSMNGGGGDDTESLNSANAGNDTMDEQLQRDDSPQAAPLMNGGGGKLKHATIGSRGSYKKKQRSLSPMENFVGVAVARNSGKRGGGVHRPLVHAKVGNNSYVASSQQQPQGIFMMDPQQQISSLSTAAEAPLVASQSTNRMRKQLIVVYYQFNMQMQQLLANSPPPAERTIIMLPNVGPTDDLAQLEQSCLSRVVQLIHILEEEGTSMGPGSARYELPTDGVTVVDRLLMLGFQVEAQSSSNQQIMWTLTTTE